MPARKMREFLNKNDIRYVTVQHSPAFTAQAVAASAHVPSKEMAKTVMLDIDGKMAMAVLPLSFQVNFDQLKEALNAGSISLMHERNFKDRFPDCEPGRCRPSAISTACRYLLPRAWPRTSTSHSARGHTMR